MHAAERIRLLRNPGAEALDQPSDLASNPSEITAPIITTPDFVPIAVNPKTMDEACGARGEQRKVGEGGCVHHVVTLAEAEQMKEHAPAESNRGEYPPSTMPVERHPRAHSYGRDTGESRRVRYIPLSESEERDLMSPCRKLLGETPIPPFGTSDTPRIQAVIHDADLHVAVQPSGEHLCDRPD